MSRTASVIVLCPRGRRETIKVTPNTSILQVLEEACKKQKLKPEDYDVYHYKKQLDLSIPIRFANLPNNAMLELNPAKTSRSESLVTIALQLESGERIVKDFPSTSSLAHIVDECLTVKSLNTIEEDKEPYCIYMHQKLTGDALKTTTLRSLGLTQGNAIIRLLYRKPQEVNEQAHISSVLPKFESKEPSVLSEENDSNSPIDEMHSIKQPRLDLDQSHFDNYSYPISHSTAHHNPREPEISTIKLGNNEMISQEIDLDKSISSNNESNKIEEMNAEIEMEISSEDKNDNLEEIGDINYIGERQAVLYNLEDITEIKKADLPDEFFELTIDDVKYLMEEYKRMRNELENQPLLTSAQRQERIIQQFSQYKNTIIRIYFPEKLVLQAVFFINETVQNVMDFLKSFLEDKNLPFYLYITPPKEKLDPNKTLLETSLVPAAVIYFGCEMKHSFYLKKELWAQISDPRAVSLAASKSRNENLPSSSIIPINNRAIKPEIENTWNDSASTSNFVQEHVQKPDTDEKLSKFIKLGKR